MKKIYHILNGDSLKDRFPATLVGEVIVLRECLVDGPVMGNTLEELYGTRLTYLSSTYPNVGISYRDDVVSEFKKIQEIEADTEVYLWFEDDLFCQVNFWFTVSLIKEKEDINLYLVRPDHHTQFGFGGLSDQELIDIINNRIKLSDITSISRLWEYYQSNDLGGLVHQAKQLKEEYPFITEAVQAHIDRIPSADSLGRPSETIKQLINQYGSDDFGVVFKAFCEREPIYGYGDLQVRRLFDEVLSFRL